MSVNLGGYVTLPPSTYTQCLVARTINVLRNDFGFIGAYDASAYEAPPIVTYYFSITVPRTPNTEVSHVTT